MITHKICVCVCCFFFVFFVFVCLFVLFVCLFFVCLFLLFFLWRAETLLMITHKIFFCVCFPLPLRRWFHMWRLFSSFVPHLSFFWCPYASKL